MVRNSFADPKPPGVDTVLKALYDEDCRTIVRHLEEPMTASEISERCDIPLSTTYRKLEALTEATLLEELTEIRSDGRHTARYRLRFEEVLLTLAEERELDMAIVRPSRTTDERLADLWSEVRKGV
ncbi:helix-turn-helix domain-containing protein [Halalkalicoccus tibetensis]|uniref:Helix-turn-helix domain-containing protein n=1 Tax=Halalkalicoccus tibetensis TaxID=175632 RepID=A0ABD5V4X9_9EURY